MCGWGNEDFKNVDGEWFFISDEESDTAEITMKEAMSEEIELIKPEHRDLPAKFLIIYEDVADAGEFERAKKCPYFRCVFSADQEL